MQNYPIGKELKAIISGGGQGNPLGHPLSMPMNVANENHKEQ